MAASATHTSINIDTTITSALSGSPLDTVNTYYCTLVYKTWGLNSINHLAAVSLLVFLAHTLRLCLQTNPYWSIPLIDKAYRFPSTLWLVYVLPLGRPFLFILALLSTVSWWSLMRSMVTVHNNGVERVAYLKYSHFGLHIIISPSIDLKTICEWLSFLSESFAWSWAKSFSSHSDIQ